MHLFIYLMAQIWSWHSNLSNDDQFIRLGLVVAENFAQISDIASRNRRIAAKHRIHKNNNMELGLLRNDPKYTWSGILILYAVHHVTTIVFWFVTHLRIQLLYRNCFFSKNLNWWIIVNRYGPTAHWNKSMNHVVTSWTAKHLLEVLGALTARYR